VVSWPFFLETLWKRMAFSNHQFSRLNSRKGKYAENRRKASTENR
jgi:hypothetical protein